MDEQGKEEPFGKDLCEVYREKADDWIERARRIIEGRFFPLKLSLGDRMLLRRCFEDATERLKGYDPGYAGPYQAHYEALAELVICHWHFPREALETITYGKRPSPDTKKHLKHLIKSGEY